MKINERFAEKRLLAPKKLPKTINTSGLKGIDAWKKDAVNYIVRHPDLGRHSNIRISV